ncbi:bifunctional phosphoribosylaminoimidazolecarboxamide formyltransferase/IMP cyclohydrolase [Tautonia plasticadhaerens]|uniref:Bifunctional purine biosynthesis protein PurH n=1 Tax=Tautonia plasticadhaerens TaxID=2527974 RepID=A0A518GXR2_9BACT|nr:bifunctional phosphoribosylaminoimidazolecarboxamide formyltransferase/IMP cyclohydrolase [Tautonia plasticadhaerens]QDV33386.1 Bifunctional purine biosynthesis protein PurH [Tautonia plasticadhaerens]
MSDTIVPIRRALLSVSDKGGLVDLARALADRGVSLLASGGTRSALLDAGLPAEEVSDYTGSPEILGGRVKTLHPRVHAGILARRDVPEDLEVLEAQGITPIDLVVVNLYPFEQTVARPGVTPAEAIEKIDVGGPTLIRAAAKNHAHLTVLTDPGQYPEFLRHLDRHDGGTSLEFRRGKALEAFRKTGDYDRAIASYLLGPGLDPESAGQASEFPAELTLGFELRTTLRYGENPHQRAAFYDEPGSVGPDLGTATIRHGKELSYNNILDLDSALRLIRNFGGPAACVLKHNNPCGAAIGATLAEAFERAYDGDPVSAFGGIVGLNRPVDLATAERMTTPGRFIECVIAPGFEADAFEALTTRPTWKNSVRLIDLGTPIGPETSRASGLDLRRVEGGLLVQDWDAMQADPLVEGRVVTTRPPNEREAADLAFSWKVCQSVKSNAIVLAAEGQLVGVGAGQMSRLDSVELATRKAGPRAAGAVLASDAFFPFRDGPDAAAAAGITAIIQPGGSRRDEEVIAACDAHGIAMIFTGRRHFRH